VFLQNVLAGGLQAFSDGFVHICHFLIRLVPVLKDWGLPGTSVHLQNLAHIFVKVSKVLSNLGHAVVQQALALELITPNQAANPDQEFVAIQHAVAISI